ncbi:MAG: hypothetical protein U0176_23765 [Bacteroidia bacterium]
MGFLDSLFGKKKKITLEEGHAINQAHVAANPVPASNENARMRQASSALTGKRFQEAIDLYKALANDFPAQKGTYLSQVGAAYYFLGDYHQAIDYYVQARDHGMTAFMIDDNIWEACEAIHSQTRDASIANRYLELCPGGSHTKAAKKMLGN